MSSTSRRTSLGEGGISVRPRKSQDNNKNKLYEMEVNNNNNNDSKKSLRQRLSDELAQEENINNNNNNNNNIMTKSTIRKRNETQKRLQEGENSVYCYEYVYRYSPTKNDENNNNIFMEEEIEKTPLRLSTFVPEEEANYNRNFSNNNYNYYNNENENSPNCGQAPSPLPRSSFHNNNNNNNNITPTKNVIFKKRDGTTVIVTKEENNIKSRSPSIQLPQEESREKSEDPQQESPENNNHHYNFENNNIKKKDKSLSKEEETQLVLLTAALSQKAAKEKELSTCKEKIENTKNAILTLKEYYQTTQHKITKLNSYFRNKEEVNMLSIMLDEKKETVALLTKKKEKLVLLQEQLFYLHEQCLSEEERKQENNNKNKNKNNNSTVKDAMKRVASHSRERSHDNNENEENEDVEMMEDHSELFQNEENSEPDIIIPDENENKKWITYSQKSFNLLEQFLSDLSSEMTALTNICIQVPNNNHNNNNANFFSVSRRNKNVNHNNGFQFTNINNINKGNNGYFSYFGGATKEHLSAKPLSTFMFGCEKLLKNADYFEEFLVLRARELCTAEEEATTREKVKEWFIQQQKRMLRNNNNNNNEDDVCVRSLEYNEDENENDDIPIFIPSENTYFPPLNYVYPNWSTENNKINEKIAGIIKNYENGVQQSKIIRRNFIKQLKILYKNEEEPNIKHRIQLLQQERLHMLRELCHYDVQKLTLQWENNNINNNEKKKMFQNVTLTVPKDEMDLLNLYYLTKTENDNKESMHSASLRQRLTENDFQTENNNNISVSPVRAASVKDNNNPNGFTELKSIRPRHNNNNNNTVNNNIRICTPRSSRLQESTSQRLLSSSQEEEKLYEKYIAITETTHTKHTSTLLDDEVSVKVYFKGELAQKKRESEERKEKEEQQLFTLRQELACIEEDNYNLTTQLKNYHNHNQHNNVESSEDIVRARKLKEAKTKLESCKNFLEMLQRENKEWREIYEQLKVLQA